MRWQLIVCLLTFAARPDDRTVLAGKIVQKLLECWFFDDVYAIPALRTLKNYRTSVSSSVFYRTWTKL
jgi:hypothetical protein